MNPEWSRLNGALQTQLKQEATFPQGIDTLLTLRRELMAALLDLKEALRREDFDAMPFPNANGYHSKTIAYSVWHIFRIEDKARLRSLQVVSADKRACWLIDYWCGKTVRGLIHTELQLKSLEKILIARRA